MRKNAFLLILIILLCICLTSCKDAYGNYEYEVLTVASYEIIVGSNENGHINETRLAFIYMDNGNPKFISNYYEDTHLTNYKNYIMIGDVNKYVVVREYRSEKEYLYLTQETYDRLFTGETTNK